MQHVSKKNLTRAFALTRVLAGMSITVVLSVYAGTAAAGGANSAHGSADIIGPTLAGQSIDMDKRNRQFQHAEALYLSGHLKEAAAAFEDLTHAYPRDSHIWLKYGNTLTKQGNFDGAATAFNTALNLDPSQGNAALNLALVRLAQTQDALAYASSHLTENSTELAQADTLQRQINTLLGTPERAVAAH